MTLDELMAPFVEDPAGAVLLFDFDGTLAPIVADPAAAVAGPGVSQRLARLARGYRLVAVVSGRPVSYLGAHLPPDLHLSGLYGLESAIDGEVELRPGADRWRASVAAAADAMTALGGGVVVERKGLSVTVHYRNDPGRAEDVHRAAEQVAVETGLLARPAKMSVELHPPVATDKGLVVTELADGARSALYVGDDRGDLPAFAALAALRVRGVQTAAVAVATEEAPAELLAAADAAVDGPDGVVVLLDQLLG